MTQYNNFDKTTSEDLNTLHKILKTANLNNLTLKQCGVEYRDNVYYPILNRGNIVRCEFVGIGAEIDDTHWAIVWDAPLGSETITVLPITSKFHEESQRTFTIGKITDFYTDKNDSSIKESYVYLSKIKEVSRKRITPWIVQNSNPSRFVMISEEQIQRIKDAIMVTYMDADYLVDILCKKELQLPLQYDDKVLSMGYRHIYSYEIDKSDKKRHIINFRLSNGDSYTLKMFYPHYNDTVKPLCQMVNYSDNIYTFHENIVKALFSNKTEKIEEAKRIINKLYEDFEKTNGNS